MLLVLLLAGAVLAEPAEAKPRHHKCKRAQATVKVQGKKRCKPIKSAFPKPRAGDERIALWKMALNPAPGLRDRRGRRLLSLKRGHGRAGQRIYAAIVATMPEGFARLDALAATPPPGLLGRASTSAARCGSTGPTSSDGFSNSVNGIRVEASQRSSGDSTTQIFSSRAGDLFIRTQFDEDVCAKLRLPRCPTAEGVLKSNGPWIKRTRISILYFEGTELVKQQVVTETRTTSTRGQTAADAKLDYVDIDDSLAVSIFRDDRGTESRENFTLKRQVRVNMRSRPESYSAGNSPSESFTGAAPRLAGWDDTGFARLVGSLIGNYRFFESEANGGGFANKPGLCAELKFAPLSDTLTLTTGQTGDVRARVESNGRADNPRATAAKSIITLIGAENATLTPPRGNGKVIPFHYTVTAAGAGVKVKGRYRATSTAGLAAEATWTQPTVPAVKRISGTFEGFNQFVGQRFDWYGTVTFTRDNPNDPGAGGTYTQSGGTATFTASGKDAGGHACQMRGSKQFGLPAGAGLGSVQGTLPNLGPPYTYTFSASLGIDPLHPAEMNVELFSCIAPDEEFEGTSHAVVVNGFAPLQTGGTPLTSPDGLVYDNGIVINQPPFLTAGFDWSLRGET